MNRPRILLLTLLVMRYVGIELERMSLAALIISLGLLVDNGIVMAEEIGRRLSLGEERTQAAIATGKSMLLPLLSSSMTTILAFMPLMLAENEAGAALAGKSRAARQSGKTLDTAATGRRGFTAAPRRCESARP